MDTIQCTKCKNDKIQSDFDMKTNGNPYKHCKDCRLIVKKNNERNNDTIKRSNDTIKRNTIEQPIDNDKKKRENRPNISDEKKQIILRQQDYKCRGPKTNQYYVCALNVSGIKFSDKKSVIPQYDHIIRWREGGNGINNLQALCPNCHWMKTRMENLILEDNDAINIPHIKGIFEALSKSKVLNDSSSSDSDEDIIDFIQPRRSRKKIFANYK